MKLNLGSSYINLDGYINIDIRESVSPDMVADLSKEFPFESNSVDEVRAFDFLEHIPLGKTIGVIEEIYRVLKPNGFFEHHTPSTDGRGAFQDPTHVSFWNIASWLYYCNPIWNFYDINARFGVVLLEDRVTRKDLNIIHTYGLMYAMKDPKTFTSGSKYTRSEEKT